MKKIVLVMDRPEFAERYLEYTDLIVRLIRKRDNVTGTLIDNVRQASRSIPVLTNALLVQDSRTLDDVCDIGRQFITCWYEIGANLNELVQFWDVQGHINNETCFRKLALNTKLLEQLWLEFKNHETKKNEHGDY